MGYQDAAIEVVATGGTLGAYVRGVDLAQEQRGEVVHAILRAFHEHLVLIFRGQKLTHERQLEVAQWFGPRFIPPPELPALGSSDDPAIVAVSNVVEGGVLGHAFVPAHTDLQYMPLPALCSILYAVEVPPAGGETSWSNLYQAYAALDDERRERIRDLRVWSINPYAGRFALKSLVGENQRYVDDEVPVFAHPLVRTHPDTGRRSLYVSYLSGGLVDADGQPLPYDAEPLLNGLKWHVDEERFYTTHSWQPGDLVVWDNRCTNHKREAFDQSERRVMYRVQVGGSRPF